jgi:type IV pilus assembly protein PilN
MIRSNLSTRPFYNERAVHFWLAVAAVVIAAATVFNVTRVLKYSRSDTQLAGEASRDETRAAQLRQQAARLRATVDPKVLEFASGEARLANDLIDRRTFSWTELFNRFEKTLPADVRITAVRPTLDKKRGIVLTLSVVARDAENVAEFVNKLEETGAFKDLQPIEDHPDESGTLMATLETVYVPGAAKKP